MESEEALGGITESALQTEEEAFNRALPDIIGSFQRSGRIGSSGLNSAVARARGELSSEREQFINNLRAQQAFRDQDFDAESFRNAQTGAVNTFLREEGTRQANRFNQQNQSNLRFQANQSRIADLINRRRELSDFNRQRTDFFNVFNQQQKQQKQSDIFGLAGLVGGGGLGAFGQFLANR